MQHGAREIGDFKDPGLNLNLLMDWIFMVNLMRCLGTTALEKLKKKEKGEVIQQVEVSRCQHTTASSRGHRVQVSPQEQPSGCPCCHTEDL